MSFERIMKNYKDKLWSIKMVKDAVKKGVITPQQFYFITSEEYKEE